MTGSGSVQSSAALGTVTISSDLVSKDIVLAVVLKLASPYQLNIVEEKASKKGSTTLSLELGVTGSIVKVTQRNTIIRAVAGPAFHGAFDRAPYYLLGGYSEIAGSQHGTSHVAALNLATLHSWMSIANDIRVKGLDALTNDNAILLQQLNDHLTKSSYLVNSAIPSIADCDVAVAIIEVGGKDLVAAEYPAVQRWIYQVLCTLGQYAASVNVSIPATLQPPNTAAPKIPLFFTGTEDIDAALSALYKASTKVPAKPVGAKAAVATESAKGKAEEAKPDATPTAGDQKGKKKKEKKPAAAATPAPTPAAEEYNISALDIRVGKIIKAWHHPDSEKLFCEEIDLGNGEIRQIASGIRAFYTTEQLTNRIVLVLCNLKSRSLAGFPSHGMVLCASNDDHTAVQLVAPSGDSDPELGERIVFDGYETGTPEPDTKIAKKKIFEKVAPALQTNADGYVIWNDAAARTEKSKQPIQAIQGMPNAHVS